MKKKIKLNIKNKVGMTASHYLALGNHFTLLENLLKNPKFDSSVTNKYHQTAHELIDVYPIEKYNEWKLTNKSNLINFSYGTKENSSREINQKIKQELKEQAKKTIKIRRNFFSRFTLDIEVNKKVLELTCTKMINPTLTIPSIDREVLEIKSHILRTKDNQAFELPKEAQLLDYETDEFIAHMLLLRLPSNICQI
jgi:hypothetical protein